MRCFTLRCLRLRRKHVVPALLYILVFTLCACRAPYHREFTIPDPPRDAAYAFHVVQTDDYGSFWDPAKAQAALEAVGTATRTGSAIVLVFIHGWHHNADVENDCNATDFRETLQALTTRLAQQDYVDSRAALGLHGPVPVIGIYVAWRGRSLPGVLDYATAWGRKAAAERVGSGDARELLLRLQGLYEQANDPQRNPGSFMGLVSIGHSFGAQVLLRTSAEYLEQQLINATPGFAGTLGTRPAPAPNDRVIRGFGDLAVLLNPAVEAYQFARIDRLYRARTYPATQAPQLVVFSSAGDDTRKYLFPMARYLTRPTRADFRSDEQADLFTQALGEYDAQRTHELKMTKADPSLVDADYLHHPGKVRSWDFSARTTFSGVTMEPLATPAISYSPVAVVYADDEIIRGHNGIFRQAFTNFLADYVAFIEGKALLVQAERLLHESGVLPQRNAHPIHDQQ